MGTQASPQHPTGRPNMAARGRLVADLIDGPPKTFESVRLPDGRTMRLGRGNRPPQGPTGWKKSKPADRRDAQFANLAALMGL